MKKQRRNLKPLLEGVEKLPGLVSSIWKTIKSISYLKFLKLNYEIDIRIPNLDGEYYIGYVRLESGNHLLIKKTLAVTSESNKVLVQEFLPTNKWSERAIGRFESAYKLLDHIENILRKRGIKYDR